MTRRIRSWGLLRRVQTRKYELLTRNTLVSGERRVMLCCLRTRQDSRRSRSRSRSPSVRKFLCLHVSRVSTQSSDALLLIPQASRQEPRPPGDGEIPARQCSLPPSHAGTIMRARTHNNTHTLTTHVSSRAHVIYRTTTTTGRRRRKLRCICRGGHFRLL